MSGKEGVTTRSVSAEVFSYVMSTAGLLEEDLETLRTEARLTSLLGVRVMGKKGWKGLSDDVHPMVRSTLEVVYDWLEWYSSQHNGHMPATLEDWKEAFTEDFIDDMSRNITAVVKQEEVTSEPPKEQENVPQDNFNVTAVSTEHIAAST